MRQLFCIALGLFLFASTVYSDNGLISSKSSHSVKSTADRLEDALEQKGMTVFIRIQHVSRQESATFFRPGTPGVEIHDLIKPFSGDRVIQKGYPNSFRETGLLEELNKDRITQLVICGAMSHMCIDATTRAAVDLGFHCQVIQDACATRDLEFGGKTITAEQVHGSFMAALGVSICAGFEPRRILGMRRQIMPVSLL